MIYHKKNCPICNQSLSKNKKYGNVSYICKNNCYYYIRQKDIVIFHEIFYFDSSSKLEIQEKIDFWKENDRYLIKLLEGDK